MSADAGGAIMAAAAKDTTNNDHHHSTWDPDSISTCQHQLQVKQQCLSPVQVWLRNRGRVIVLPLLFVVLCSSLIGWRAAQWVRSPFFPVAGVALPLAKAFVTIAEVCFGLLFLPVSRNLVTWLRSTWVRHVVDLDQSLGWHKYLAIIGAVAGCAHGICISVAYHSAHVLDQRTFNSPWWAWSTGWVLLVLILVCYPFAMCRGFVMKSKVGKTLSSFRSHWVTHHILILVFTPLLIVHSIPALPKGDVEGHSLTSSKAWLFLAVPVLIYVLERANRALRKAVRNPAVLDASLLPDDVLTLTLRKPRGFHFTSGMYAFIKVPSISTFEWHPFTITSAPQDNFITMHIRKAGNWTAALHELIAASSSSQEASATKTDSKPASRQSHDVRIEIMATAPRSSQDQATLVPLSASWGQQAAGGCQWGPLHTTSPHSAPLVTAEGHGSGSHSIRLALFKNSKTCGAEPAAARPGARKNLPAVFLDGPFGAPTQAWKEYEVVTLIGAGIGVTPMASVLRSLLHNLYMACCDNCGHINQRVCAGSIRQQKVYFHWVLRNVEGMQWLQQILETIAQNDPQRRFELHVHITGTKPLPPPAAADMAHSPDSCINLCSSSSSPVSHGPNDLQLARITSQEVVETFHTKHHDAVAHHQRNCVHYSSGRPNFRAVLSSIQASHSGRAVGVFYCGPPALGHELGQECVQLSRAALKSGGFSVASSSGSTVSWGTDSAGDGCSTSSVCGESESIEMVGRGAQLHFYQEVF